MTKSTTHGKNVGVALPGPGADSGTRVTGQFGMATEMARRILVYNWSATALGQIESWSPALRTAVNLCLGSRMCSCIYWGSEHLILYNDAYGSILGTKHPWALGRTVDEVWPEIIDIIGPLMKQTFAAGETTGGDDAAIFLNRSGYVEEFYCSFSYAPIIDHHGDIEGVFATLPETSVRVIGERRLRTLQKLGADARGARHPQQMLEIAAEVIAENSCDIPFAALYSWRDDDSVARLSATANIEAGLRLSPLQIDLDDDSRFSTVAREALSHGYALLELNDEFTSIPLGAWRVPARQLLVLAFVPYGDEVPNAVMLAGVSPHKRLDDDHLAFFTMLADQITRSLAEAFTHEQEDARVRDLQQRARAVQEAERLRIARDLHDTLLQSMQGMRFLLEAGLERARLADPSAIGLFENALSASIHAINEGREVLSLLRSTAPTARDLSASLSALGAELVTSAEIKFALDVSGEPREIRPEVWSETYGLCREALANGVRHAHATSIRVEMNFGDAFRVSITDDGCGMDAGIASAGRSGHFGMQGMRERAGGIGGTLDVRSAVGEGTSILLSVPKDRAYVSDQSSVPA